MVIDRGIYSRETFLECLREPGLCLLTWEQAYSPGEQTPPEAGVERFDLIRKRNHSGDLIRVGVEAREVPHPRLPGAGLVVCRLHRPGRDPAEIAILRLGPPLEVREIVTRMTRRWLQENDFKYSNAHFGLDQITSYRVIPYARLSEEVRDRQTANGLRLALQQQARELRAELGSLLVTLREGKRRLEKPMREVLELQEALDTSLDAAVFNSLCRKIQPLLKGGSFLVRYADDFVMGFENRRDAERVLEVLWKRFARYGLGMVRTQHCGQLSPAQTANSSTMSIVVRNHDLEEPDA